MREPLDFEVHRLFGTPRVDSMIYVYAGDCEGTAVLSAREDGLWFLHPPCAGKVWVCVANGVRYCFQLMSTMCSVKF